jgi:hypothetical protein
MKVPTGITTISFYVSNAGVCLICWVVFAVLGGWLPLGFGCSVTKLFYTENALRVRPGWLPPELGEGSEP